MNYKQIFFLIFLLISNLIFSQDVEIYHRTKNDNFEMPILPDSISFDDFQLLSRNIKTMDMAYSAIVPGYVHFRIQEKKIGYYLLATRIIGYSGLIINYIRLNNIDKRFGDLFNDDSGLTTDKVLFTSSLSLIISSYLFDWIHGKVRLEKKQELIRYRYGIKIKLDYNVSSVSKKSLYPSLYFGYNF